MDLTADILLGKVGNLRNWVDGGSRGTTLPRTHVAEPSFGAGVRRERRRSKRVAVEVLNQCDEKSTAFQLAYRGPMHQVDVVFAGQICSWMYNTRYGGRRR